MEKETQISASISKTTKEQLERYVRATGVKKGHVIEQALLHYLRAMEEIPAEFIIHPRIVVTLKSFKTILKQIESGKPTKALRDLMRDGD